MKNEPLLKSNVGGTDRQVVNPPWVTIQGCRYQVDLGGESAPRIHLVGKDKTCSCGETDCTAIRVVREYLLEGGERAPDHNLPAFCPICGSKIQRERAWDGKYTHIPGWRCQAGGLRHFLQAKAERIRRQQIENPWLIPPVSGYPGLRRDELLTWEECQAINRRIFAEIGYDPTA